jgi:hypothetical protein
VVVTESHLPAVEDKKEASHPPENTIVGGADRLLHDVARGNP